MRSWVVVHVPGPPRMESGLEDPPADRIADCPFLQQGRLQIESNANDWFIKAAVGVVRPCIVIC